MKFALEGIKLMFLINGASAVAILTFIGNIRIGSVSLVWAMLLFAFGAVMSAPAMIFAYLTQLHYGNASQEALGSGTWRTAVQMHYLGYASIALALLLFVGGAIFAAHGLLHISATNSLGPAQH